jgi:hypothetical protein
MLTTAAFEMEAQVLGKNFWNRQERAIDTNYFNMLVYYSRVTVCFICRARGANIGFFVGAMRSFREIRLFDENCADTQNTAATREFQPFSLFAIRWNISPPNGCRAASRN